MTPRKIVLNQIRHRETPELPYTLPITEEVEVRLDEYYEGEEWRSSIAQYFKSYGVTRDVSSEQIDEKHSCDVYGVVWRTDKNPPVVEKAPLSRPDFQGYDFPKVDLFVDPVLVDDVKKSILENQHLFSHIGAPCLWSSWYLRGFETTMMDIVAEEDFYVELLDRFTELSLEVIGKYADIPVDAVMMGDDWGVQRGVMIGPDRWRKLYKPRYAEIFSAIRKQGKVSIMHCCGSVYDIMDDIVEIGLDVLESVQPEAANMNPYELKKRWGDKIAFWGGLGTQYTIPFATPEEIRGEIRKLKAEMSKGGGYILAPAKHLRPEVPTENAVAVLEEFTGRNG